uniref:ST3 beta-galactoside alpha-2,3-sialyltransferase 4 n=1 Tax=Pyxicephalus adspersus TaxID=30357 RepID=A0AAV2ZQ15_PYXAD|nr:TPA: hypothetical protein GDO54_004001 [Pyxicephalus adspersus]
MCTPGQVASRASLVISNYSRNHSVFLGLSDYFWATTQSKFPLPYGTKGSGKLQCKRCIVVGSGYRMKNSSLGDIIDTYDIVIRLNNAPVHKYEKDVGSKTTLRFFYPESAFFDPVLDNNPDTLMVLVPFKNLDIQWLKTILNDEKRINRGFWKKPPIIWNVKSQNIRILNPYFMQIAATKLLGYIEKNNKKPTTGMLAITFALHFCDVVDIAGFGYPALSNKKEPIHYYEKVTLKSMAVSGHNITLEAIAIGNPLQNRLIHNLTYFFFLYFNFYSATR